MSKIVIQRPTRLGYSPTALQLRKFGMHVLNFYKPDAEVTIRIVSSDEIRNLNATYRHKDKPTNVLSFKMAIPLNMALSPVPLGDVVICADVVNQEAIEQNKLPLSHWAHMVVHGILHLLGHDHEEEQDAALMESIEINLMKELGFNNPYHLGNDE